MAQFPAPGPTWTPISGHQFIQAAISTALTIPSAVSIGGTSGTGYQYVAILQAQGASQWVRMDGTAVTAAYTGGKKLNDGDFLIVYGLASLKAVRVIQDSTGGSLVVEYYSYVDPRV